MKADLLPFLRQTLEGTEGDGEAVEDSVDIDYGEIRPFLCEDALESDYHRGKIPPADVFVNKGCMRRY
jgi:hypothetical protein